MRYSLLNWHNDPIMQRLLREEQLRATMKALNGLYEKGLIAWCPGGKVKLTPQMQRESWRLWV